MSKFWKCIRHNIYFRYPYKFQPYDILLKYTNSPCKRRIKIYWVSLLYPQYNKYKCPQTMSGLRNFAKTIIVVYPAHLEDLSTNMEFEDGVITIPIGHDHNI